MEFRYFMPTDLYFGENCISKHSSVFGKTGSRALILTGRSSAKRNGSLEDVLGALEREKIAHVIFDEIEENPSFETAERAAETGKRGKVDFVIGIGGGSPMDCAKAAAFLIANPGLKGDALLGEEILSHIPIVEVPTTAGTGSETTPFSVLTLHSEKTKTSIRQKAFAAAAFLDARYMADMPASITNNTAIDALSHLIEGYLCRSANYMSDFLAECGFRIFGECMGALKKRFYSPEDREKLLLASTIGGMVIAQAGTSLPHAMGYFPTYQKKVPHGRINGLLTAEYLKLFEDKRKITGFLSLLGFDSIESFGVFLEEVLESGEAYTEEDIRYYTAEMMKNRAKLSTHPYEVTEDMIYRVYKNSLMK